MNADSLPFEGAARNRSRALLGIGFVALQVFVIALMVWLPSADHIGRSTVALGAGVFALDAALLPLLVWHAARVAKVAAIAASLLLVVGAAILVLELVGDEGYYAAMYASGAGNYRAVEPAARLQAARLAEPGLQFKVASIPAKLTKHGIVLDRPVALLLALATSRVVVKDYPGALSYCERALAVATQRHRSAADIAAIRRNRDGLERLIERTPSP